MLYYHGQVAGLYRMIATYKIAQGKNDETLDCLEKMLYHIQMENKASVGDKYDSPFMNEMEAYVALQGLGEFVDLEVHNNAWYVLNGRLNQNRYDPIRGTERFVRITEELAALSR